MTTVHVTCSLLDTSTPAQVRGSKPHSMIRVGNSSARLLIEESERVSWAIGDRVVPRGGGLSVEFDAPSAVPGPFAPNGRDDDIGRTTILPVSSMCTSRRRARASRASRLARARWGEPLFRDFSLFLVTAPRTKHDGRCDV